MKIRYVFPYFHSNLMILCCVIVAQTMKNKCILRQNCISIASDKPTVQATTATCVKVANFKTLLKPSEISTVCAHGMEFCKNSCITKMVHTIQLAHNDDMPGTHSPLALLASGHPGTHWPRRDARSVYNLRKCSINFDHMQNPKIDCTPSKPNRFCNLRRQTEPF